MSKEFDAAIDEALTMQAGEVNYTLELAFGTNSNPTFLEISCSFDPIGGFGPDGPVPVFRGGNRFRFADVTSRHIVAHEDRRQSEEEYRAACVAEGAIDSTRLKEAHPGHMIDSWKSAILKVLDQKGITPYSITSTWSYSGF